MTLCAPQTSPTLELPVPPLSFGPLSANVAAPAPPSTPQHRISSATETFCPSFCTGGL